MANKTGIGSTFSKACLVSVSQNNTYLKSQIGRVADGN